MADFTPYLRGYSRVFILDGGPRPDHAPLYKGCMMAGGVSQDFGDVEDIECPSPDLRNTYEVVGEIQSAAGRATTTLTARYALDQESDLLRIAKQRCRVDVVIVGGQCENPNYYNRFQKAKHLENGLFTNHSTEDEGALESGDNAEVNESADLSARVQYEVLPITFGAQACDLVTTEIVAVAICDSPACAGNDCLDESTGCQRIYAVQKSVGGSPTPSTEVVYTIDGGVSWNTSQIDTLDGGEDPTGIACLGGWVGVISNASNSIHYVEQDDLDAVGDETWQEVATGFVAAKEPNDISAAAGYAYIVGDAGYVYGTDDLTVGVDVLNAAEATRPADGVAIADNLLCVHALNNDMAVAGGENGAFLYTLNRTTWNGVDPFVGVGVNITAVWANNEQIWWAGTSNGRLWFTVDQGVHWTEKAFSGSGTGRVDDISFSNDAVGYMAHANATPRGRLFRTHSCGGGSGEAGGWYLLPETGHGSMPAGDRFNAVAACKYDCNFVVAGGLGDNGTDGILVLGED